MKKKSDKQTFKMKKNNKKRKKEKDSNSSRDSLELTIKSYQENSKINHKDMGNGENIKFLFNEFPVNKNKISNNKNQKFTSNGQKEKEEFDFSKLLLNYVNQTGRTNEKKSKNDEIGSIIYTKKNEVLTLNGENNNSNNNDEFSNQISKSSISETNSNKRTQKEEINKKIKEKKNKQEIKINKKINNENQIKNLFNTKTLINKKVNIKNNKENIKPIKHVMILSDKKMRGSEKNVESVINSNYNKFTNSNKIIVSNKNTFTTATNTQDSSFKSLQYDFKKKNYDYLNFSEISLKKRLILQNKIFSGKKNLRKEEIDNKNKNKEKQEENLFDKIRNLNISLEVEKSYSNYFSKIINLQRQKMASQKQTNKIQKNSNKDGKSLHSNSQINKRYFYYPDKYYIDKNSNLHSKYHVSNLFDKLRNKI